MRLRRWDRPLSFARQGRPFLLLLLLPLLVAAGEPGVRLPGFTWGPGIQYPGWTLPDPDRLVAVPAAPPAPFAEVVPPPPQGAGAQFAWDPGHWYWSGEDYVWVAGHYVERPYRGSTWVPARWADDHRGEWIYTPGHWR
jgi:YXWGXW repeat-containing protein